jgi:hypothetical protein
VCLILAGCGGGQKQAATTSENTSTGSNTAHCARAWHCGHPLTADDLPDAFLAWPQVKSIYKDGNSYAIYTRLSPSDYSTAVKICRSAFVDLFGDGIKTPVIVVLSEGGPADVVQLATGASEDSGCTGSRV